MLRHRKFSFILLLLATLGFAASNPDAARERRLEWWRDARFGMFIHWGLYAIPAGSWQGKEVPGIGEWIMNHAKIPVGEYEKLASKFNPIRFDADQWVSVAKNAGMKYIVITAKHHDGFAMFKSQASKYNIVDATPYHHDPMKDLAAACQRQGLRLCFYYSQTQDWHEPDGVGNNWDFPDESKKDFNRYFQAKVIPQVRELLTQYGPIGLIWFDTPRNMTKEQSKQLADLVHQLQPDCLVNGRVGNGMGDYDSAGDNQISFAKGTREWETPVTLNDTWGFKRSDDHWKSPEVLIHQLAMTVSQGGNYLLNVGPTAEGVIPWQSVDRLRQVGEWMKVNNSSIYGSKASPYPYDFPWGVITSGQGKLFLHVFQWPKSGNLTLYGLKSKVGRAELLSNTGWPVVYKQERIKNPEHYTLSLSKLPEPAPDPIDTVIALSLAGKPDVVTELQQQPGGNVTLPAYLADMHANTAKLDTRGVVDHWTSKDDWAEWKFQVSQPGTFEVRLITSEQKYGNGWEGGQHIAVSVAGKTLDATVKNDGKLDNPGNPYWPYVISKVGTVTVDKPGELQLSLKPQSIESPKGYGLTLVSVELTPQ
ncbi:MAG TPA: alpha-L-fucosidase [Bryobacteraceae bacterium]|jgi:alpha-L-fucosidase